MFSLVQLECFVAVAEELHFGAAAGRLQMTQPPLSRQIQLLERELGTLLFSRTSRKVALTPAGAALLPGARRLLDLSAKTATDVRRVAGGASGAITIGYTAMAAQSTLPTLMRRIKEEMPQVTVILRELFSADQMDELLKGTIDLGLLRPLVARTGIAMRPLVSEPLLAAVPDSHPLALSGEPVPLRRLAREPFLMYSPSVARYFHDLVLTLFVTAKVQPEIVHYAGQVQTLLSFVHAGLGVALVPASAALVRPADVALLPLESGTGADAFNVVKLDVAWNEDSANPVVHRTLEFLLNDAAPISVDAQIGVDAHRSAS